MLPRAGVVLALAAAGGLAVWNHTVTVAAGQPVPQPSAVPASTVLRACPAPGLAGSPTAHLALFAGPTSAGTGRAVVTYSGTTQGTPLLSLTQAGVLSLTGVRSGRGRRAAPGPPDGGEDYPAPRRGLGRRGAGNHSAGGGAPDRPGEHPGARQGSGGGADQETAFGGGAPSGQNDFALPASPQGGGHRGRFPGHSRGPDTEGEASRRPMPRSRPLDDDAGLSPLSPLPPLPPRAPRRNRWEGDADSGGAPPELSRDTGEERDQIGREERATGAEWDRARREEWDERDW